MISFLLRVVTCVIFECAIITDVWQAMVARANESKKKGATLKRKRKMETGTPSPKKRRRTETEVSKNSFALKNVKTSAILWKHSFIDSESFRFSFGK